MRTTRPAAAHGRPQAIGVTERDRPGAVPRAPTDLRLVIVAVTGWLATAVALGHPPASVAVAGAVAAVGGWLAVLLAADRGAALRFVALGCFGVTALLLPLAARSAHARASPLAGLAREHVAATVELTVTSDPHPLAASGPAGSPRALVEAEVDRVRVAGRQVAGDGSVLVFAPAALWHDVLPGQRVRLDVTMQPALPGDLRVAALTAVSDPALLGGPPWWQGAAGRVRSALRQAASGLPEEPRGLLPGLVDGDTSGLDPVLAEQFRIAGLTHLVAVSGTTA